MPEFTTADWALHDLALCLGAPECEYLALDGMTPEGPAPVGTAAVLAARSYPAGPEWRDLVRSRIRVEYRGEIGRGRALTISSKDAGATVGAHVSDAGRDVLTIEQEPLTSGDRSEPLTVHTGRDMWSVDLHRVRVARWVCVTGEVIGWYCNHVRAQDAGLPAALVPQSLLLGLVERYVAATASAAPHAITMTRVADVYAGDRLELTSVPTEGPVWTVMASTARGAVFRADVEPATERTTGGAS